MNPFKFKTDNSNTSSHGRKYYNAGYARYYYDVGHRGEITCKAFLDYGPYQLKDDSSFVTFSLSLAMKFFSLKDAEYKERVFKHIPRNCLECVSSIPHEQYSLFCPEAREDVFEYRATISPSCPRFNPLVDTDEVFELFSENIELMRKQALTSVKQFEFEKDGFRINVKIGRKDACWEDTCVKTLEK